MDVLVLTYNQQRYIADTLEGLLMVSDTENLRLIVSDDCSTDNTFEIIQSYEHRLSKIYREVIVLKQARNLGVWDHTKHIVLGYVESVYFTFNAGDDISFIDRFTVLRNVFESEDDVMAVSSGHSAIVESGIRVSEKTKTLTFETLSIPRYPKFKFIGATAAYKSDVIKDLLEKIHCSFYNEDFLFSMACASVGKVIHVENSLIYYRIHEQSLSLMRNKSFSVMKEEIRFFLEQRSEQLSVLMDLYNHNNDLKVLLTDFNRLNNILNKNIITRFFYSLVFPKYWKFIIWELRWAKVWIKG